MNLILTCQTCATVRPLQGNEQHHEPEAGMSTQAHCGTCKKVTPHWYSIPEKKREPAKMELERRKA